MSSITTHSPEETQAAGKALAHTLPSQALLCFSGDLGAGKTTFLKGLISEFTGHCPDSIDSPTFTYLHPYEASDRALYHFDLYRLQDARDFIAKGFDDYLHSPGVCCIEWPERITSLLPPHRYHITLHYTDAQTRTITTRLMP